ncbi:MAG: DEAD/DEAH box helicase family protein [Nitrososphaerota archaeon]|jgi:DNA excision repair protein ERCC-2|nr:DEAD/DEAH box helicase family protein [Nitrososphaerota archaeon]
MTTPLPPQVMEYFPYPKVRIHQDQFINTIYNAINKNQSVLIEGSNGLGKTISSLTACLPTAIEKNLKILYVARTHRQHERVIDELCMINKKHPISGISIKGRNEMCLNAFAANGAFDSKSLMEMCDLLKAKGRCPYYKNVERQTYDYLQIVKQLTTKPYTATEIQQICKKKELCPYELVKAALPDTRVIALSYLYAFDPMIQTAFLKHINTDLSKTILIVDEAHNLPETAVDISSNSLSLFVLRQAEMEANNYGNKDIEQFIHYFRNEIDQLTANINREEIINPDKIIDIIKKGGIPKPRNFFEHMHETGIGIRRTLLAEGKNPRSYINSTSDFLLQWLETCDSASYINIASRYYTEKSQTAKLEIVALDPSNVTEPVFSNTYANVIMSGTLQPLNAYLKITKLSKNTAQFIAPSPFPKEHIYSAVCYGVTTALEKRTPTMYKTIIKRITEVVENTPKNTGIFVASFDVMNSLLNEGLTLSLDRPLYKEERGMTSEKNEKLVSDFKTCGNKTGAVFLGVLGGRTSEGVDFPGDQMNSVVIVGVPYAEPTPRVKAQIDYYEKCFPLFGREYGYILPAMKKASQAAGRPVRTLNDHGAIIFLDSRYATGYCRNFLPSWVNNGMKALPNQDNILAKELKTFFQRIPDATTKSTP